MSGYRGFLSEISHTGSMRSLVLMVRTGARHILTQLGRRPTTDGVAHFLENYGPDGVRAPDPGRRSLTLAAESCLVCGLCEAACARIGGQPPLSPRDAVACASRLAIDWTRLGIAAAAESADEGGSGCAACRACEPACPAAIPIAAIQAELLVPEPEASLAPSLAEGARSPRELAKNPGIG